jgi:hypothetical protein
LARLNFAYRSRSQPEKDTAPSPSQSCSCICLTAEVPRSFPALSRRGGCHVVTMGCCPGLDGRRACHLCSDSRSSSTTQGSGESKTFTLRTSQYEVLAASVFNALPGPQPQPLWTSRIREPFAGGRPASLGSSGKRKVCGIFPEPLASIQLFGLITPEVIEVSRRPYGVHTRPPASHKSP